MACIGTRIRRQSLKKFSELNVFLEDNMQDVYAVLREKETAIERVRREIEALRLVCHMMESEKDSRVESIRITLESSIEPEGKAPVVPPGEDEEKKAALEEILARFEEEPPNELKKENGGSVLLQFRQVARNASQTFLKRVRDRHLWEREAQRNGIRDFFERFGRAA